MNVLKKLILQKKYSRYKQIFAINIDEIIDIWVKKFIKLNQIQHINETNYTNKYFRLEDVYHDDYFNKNKWKIIIVIKDIKDSKKILYILSQLYENLNNFLVVYEIELNDLYINNSIFLFLEQKNNINIYIKSTYKKNDLQYIKKIIKKIKGREIYLWLDYLNKQEDVDNWIIFEIVSIIKNNWWIINSDFIRLESAYKNLYILWPKELHLDLFEFCNSSCIFCYTNHPWFLEDSENNYKMTFNHEYYTNLFKKISYWQTETVALWITWEPFLHPNIKEILLWLKWIDLKIWFLTNWYKLFPNLKEIIENKNIKHFYINISSGNFNTFKAIRPLDNFNNFIKTWSAIKILREKRVDIIIRWLYVITPQNINWIEDFINLSDKNNISEIEFKRVVPYEFSNKLFYFTLENIFEIIKILKTYKQKINHINNNIDYIIDEFDSILKWDTIQYPEDKKNDTSRIVWKTMNCYNSYFYISFFRNSAYTCGKFEAKIWKLTNLDLYKLLFEKKEIFNIFLSAKNIKNFLWEKKWKEKCSRCHHMDVNNMVSKYIKIKNISLTIENDKIIKSWDYQHM